MSANKSDLLRALQWRLVGPFRGGRVVAAAGHPTNPLVFYFGSTGGGVWKTEDAGVSWRNTSDGFLGTASVGAIAIAESDPNVIYIGMGESTIRGNVSHGDGVYKSLDGGRTWAHLGLSETRQIAKVRVHPKNPDLVYVAAFGHVWGANDERGLYRSQDGGKTWELILSRSNQAGAIDLAMDATNPRILYASFWEAYRRPWELVSGGPGCSLYKSTDGGDTWVEITNNPGMPKGVKGKICVAVSPVKPERLWACVEAEDGGIYRSDDAGATWTRMNGEQTLRQRAWYFSHVVADTQDAETVYCLNVQFWKSTDGGKSFSSMATPHADNHELWIDPTNNRRMVVGNDGGASVSLNGGVSWSSQYNQPTCEFYHVTTDTRFPYRVYGAQQDNSTISVPSRSQTGAITMAEYYEVGGGESGYIAVRPDNPNIVYAGNYGGYLTRYDHSTRLTWDVSPWPEIASGQGAGELRHRFQWTFPTQISPFNPNKLYACGNQVFVTHDEGQSWEIISPDLTRNDHSKMGRSGGPITKDCTSVEYYGTIFAFAESSVQEDLLWAGSDDGLVHVSRDGGKTWQNVTPPAALLPEWSLISIIEPSYHAAGTAYVAATRYKLDDHTPYILKTTDFGQTWQLVTDGIKPAEFTRVVREDPERAGLLYAGTEQGVYLSLDGGLRWQPLQQNLPVVPVHDLVVRDGDLVAGTHGRSFWILDDLSVLRQLPAAGQVVAAHLFQPRPGLRVHMPLTRYFKENGARDFPIAGGIVVQADQDKDRKLTLVDAGANPADGLWVHYFLAEQPEGEVKLRFRDARGELIREFSSKPQEGPDAKPAEQVPAEAGINRFVWNMRYPDAVNVPGIALRGGSVSGPLAAPGAYTAELVVGDQVFSQRFQVVRDPRSAASDAELQQQFQFLLQVRDKLSETHSAVLAIRDLKEQVQWWVKRTQAQANAEAVALAADGLTTALAEVEAELLQPRAKTNTDFLNFPVKLNNKLAAINNVVATAERAPSKQSRDLYADLSARVDEQLARLRRITADDVPGFTRLVQEAGVPPLTVKSF